MDRAIRNPALRFMVHGHVVLALGAALHVWWIGEHWFGQGLWIRTAAAFFGTIACYGYNRLMRSRDAAVKEVAFFAWYRQHARIMWAVVGTSAAIAVALIASELPILIERLWIVIVPALLYVTPLRTKTGQAIGLRQVPGLKSLLVAWVWAAGTVMLAAHYANSLAWILVSVLLGFYWSIAIAFDLRDTMVDGRGLRTMPQLLGIRASKAFAGLLLLPLAMLILFQFLWTAPGDRSAHVLLPLFALIACAALVFSASPDRRGLHWLLLDGCIALIPLLAILGSLC